MSQSINVAFFWTTTTHSLPADNTWGHKIVGKSLKLKFVFLEGVNFRSLFFLNSNTKRKRNHFCTRLSHSLRTHRAIYWFYAFYQTIQMTCIALAGATSLNMELFFAKLPLCLFVLFCHDFKPAKSAPSLFPAHTLKKRLNLEFCHLAAGECVDLTTLVICLRIYGAAKYFGKSLETIDVIIKKKLALAFQSEFMAFYFHVILNPSLNFYFPSWHWTSFGDNSISRCVPCAEEFTFCKYIYFTNNQPDLAPLPIFSTWPFPHPVSPSIPFATCLGWLLSLDVRDSDRWHKKWNMTMVL